MSFAATQKHYYECRENGVLMQISTFSKKLTKKELSEFKKVYREAFNLDLNVKIEVCLHENAEA